MLWHKNAYWFVRAQGRDYEPGLLILKFLKFMTEITELYENKMAGMCCFYLKFLIFCMFLCKFCCICVPFVIWNFFLSFFFSITEKIINRKNT